MVIAEGVLGRMISAFARVEPDCTAERCDELVEISHGHLRNLVRFYWSRFPQPEPEPDAAPDA